MRFLIIPFLFFSHLTLAQTKFCITGKIKDSTNNNPVSKAYVEIIITKSKSSETYFTITDSLGYFKLCYNKPIKSLSIQCAGYNDKIIKISNSDSLYTLNDVLISPSIAVIKGITLKSKKDKEPVTIEKKTYNLSENVLTTGGTALDALRLIPAINVDSDGNISLRGSGNVTVYINGKLSSLQGNDLQALLLQIPSANIESIDVNTNPGAKQDAEGMSGIININLKQNNSQKSNGYITLGAGTNNKYNGTLAYNTKYKKFGFSNTLSFRQNEIVGKGYNLRKNYLTNDTNSINQISTSNNFTLNGTLSGVIDYNINKKSTLSFNYLASINQDNDDDVSNNELLNVKDSLFQLIRRTSDQIKKTQNVDLGLSYRKTFEKAQHSIIALINYSSTKNNNRNDINQVELNTLNRDVISINPYLLFNKSNNNFTNQLAQIDYTKPYINQLKLETGLKYSGRLFDIDFQVDSFNYGNGKNVFDSGKSNHFIYTENITAAYGMITNQWKELIKYNLGLRIENTNINGEQKLTNETFKNSYINLFPSGSLQLVLQKKYKIPDIQLSYSRRINRPSQNQLNPFLSINDPYNFFKGNPKLKPELTNAIELSAIYQTKKSNYTGTLYYRKVNTPISRFRVIDSNSISTVSFFNLDYNTSSGVEFIARFAPIGSLKMTLNANLFKYFVAGNIQGNSLNNERISYSGKFNLNYTLPKKIDFQSSFNYNGPSVGLQGYIRSMYSLEIGVKKSFIKDKLTLSVNLADVFDNRRFNIVMEGSNFDSEVYRKRETRILTFNATWKFGQSDSNQEKKPKTPERGMDMDM